MYPRWLRRLIVSRQLTPCEPRGSYQGQRQVVKITKDNNAYEIHFPSQSCDYMLYEQLLWELTTDHDVTVAGATDWNVG